jgi:hypothetical protein
MNSSFTSKIHEINEIFHLPIHYNDEKMELNRHILEDLELVDTVNTQDKTENSQEKSMYSFAFQPQTAFGKEVMNQFPKYYTTDVEFLKENQLLLKSLLETDQKEEKNQKELKNQKDHIAKDDTFTKIMENWDEIKNDTGFKDRYHYLDWTMWEHLNESDSFLQIMSIYNLTAPLMSLLMPFVILIVPFFVIRMKGLSINFTEYYQILTLIVSNHSIGKLFTNFKNVKLDEKMYLIVSVGFYFFSIYQNFLTCYRFYRNLKKIHDFLKQMEDYLKFTESEMTFLLNKIQTLNLSKFQTFSKEIQNKLSILREMRESLVKITPYRLSIQKVTEFGYVLQRFYQMYKNPVYHEAMIYSFGFHGYLDNMRGFSQNVHLHHARLIDAKQIDSLVDVRDDASKKKRKREKKGKKDTKDSKDQQHPKDQFFFKKMYYPTLIGQSSAVRNDFHFDKNYILTGPNASGKTTILKSTLINIILTQQMGAGFYEEANYKPFKYIHCYLNIPDTSARDSLFQAEARRCKNILDSIDQNPKERHFCAFDELYSGTNPDEAVMSAYAFLKYLNKKNDVYCLLTTHFIQLCEYLEKEKRMVNMHMHTEATETGDDFVYHYLMKKGISKVRGGMKVLVDMNYPKEILLNSRKIQETI